MAILTFTKIPEDMFDLIRDDAPFAKGIFHYAMMWDAASIDLLRFDNLSAESLLPNGRVWGESSDLQWRKRGGQYHLVFITADTKDVPVIFPAENHKPLDKPKTAHKVYLWGEYNNDKDKTKDEWIEVKVPRFFEYLPFIKKKTKRVRLNVYEYEVPHETRTLWQMGTKTDFPVISKVYRYGEFEGEN